MPRLILFPKNRVNRVLERTVRGLLWHHYRVKPGPTIKFYISMHPEVSGIAHILQLTTASSLGDTVFQYRHATAIEDPEQSVRFLRFYAKTTFLILLRREEPVVEANNST